MPESSDQCWCMISYKRQRQITTPHPENGRLTLANLLRARIWGPANTNTHGTIVNKTPWPSLVETTVLRVQQDLQCHRADSTHRDTPGW